MAEAQFYSAGSPIQPRCRYVFNGGDYDALNRLQGATYSYWTGSSWASTNAYKLTAITYDASGNLTALQRYKDNATLVDNLSYTIPGSSNRMSAITDAVSGNPETWDARTGNFTYDANGNLLTAPARGVHAEVNAINYAVSQGWVIRAVAASRPVCSVCAVAIQAVGAVVASVMK